ncbi:TlpA family protein disulfide reductase [Gluconacetobacter diazotrophicus]|uniref:TlpA family protein disulfide reductase n=2 Tax=Gluconacetobacter diazotrophicus TaxID=33996 RepID=A0A7W4FDY0_GLUDI|nr:TlpA disulfide reductase family protein [Gluconacetobacter diazotrophicus]MBB2155949.1 TlpA family protein disulfide reductase [Gluconacetobacter diazotrophicus]CAP56911.1 putative Thiol:disulfide interchange protein tlpA [Gluconacetobacter diazotrophicus PA1 5]
MPQILTKRVLTEPVDRRALLANGGTLLAAWLGCNSILAPRAMAEEGPAPVALPTRAEHPPRALPDLAFTDEGGATHRPADWRGRIVVLNVWATWCQPCVAEMPALSVLARQVAPAGDIAVLPVSVDHGGAATVRRFYHAHGIAGLPVLCDPDMRVPTALHEDGVPVSLVIDRGGREILRISGPVLWDAPDLPARLRHLAAGG